MIIPTFVIWDKPTLHADGNPQFHPSGCECEICWNEYDELEDEEIVGIEDYRWRTGH
jgi:hypothetical protein